MKQPYYEIGQETKTIIFELLKKCKELDLGNINFHYYPTKASMEETEFYLTEYKNYWELTVKQRWAKTIDIYRLGEGTITYQYSEKD